MTDIVQQKSDLNFKLLHWNPVAIWSFKIAGEDGNCTICTQKITLKCIECINSADIEKKQCIRTKGKCGHGFHNHCIKKWLSTGPQKCPICQIPWNTLHDNMDENSSTLRRLVKKDNLPIQPNTTNIISSVPSSLSTMKPDIISKSPVLKGIDSLIK
jgi:RING-box protein 1